MKQILLSFTVFFSFLLKAQLPACTWGFVPQGVNAFQTIYDIVKDEDGNLIVAGNLNGRCDLNASSNPEDTFYSKTGYNYYLLKTSPTGKFIWAKLIEKTSAPLFFQFAFKKLQIDKGNNIVVCSSFSGSFDFDPGSGTALLKSHFATYDDMGVAKYDANGNYLWAFSVGDTQSLNTLKVNTMALLSDNSILIDFYSNGTVDMDPGAGINKSVGGGTSLVYYSSNGNFISQTKLPTIYSYPIDNRTLDVDNNDNAFVLSIGYYETTVTKVNSAGITQWTKKMGDFTSGSRAEANAIYINAAGDFYLHGTFSDTVDFDLGPGITNRISSSQMTKDCFLARYNSNGDLIWVNAFTGNIELQNGWLNPVTGNVLISGNIKGTVALNNGKNVSSLSAMVNNGFVAEFNPTGNCNWATALTDTITLKYILQLGNNQFALVGRFSGTRDIDPGAANYPLTTVYSSDYTGIYGVSTTGIQSTLSHNKIEVYPNPSLHGDIHISYDSGIEHIRVYTLQGQLVYDKTMAHCFDIKLSLNLSSGIYFLKINEGQLSKIIVE